MRIRFQADADLKFDFVRAVRLQEPLIDFKSAVESTLRSAKDPEILQWAAAENRVVVSHDRRTMLAHFRNRIASGQSSPGLLILEQGASIREVAEAITLLWSVDDPDELRDQARHLPSLVRHLFPR